MAYIKSGWECKPDGWEEQDIKIYSGNNNTPNNNNISNTFDMIFVLAGGLDNNNNINEWTKRRLDIAHQLYIEGIKIVCLGGGTYHKPANLNKLGYVVHESTASSNYLISLGVKPNDIYKEWGSYDTIANGYFAYTNFILPLKLKNILVITSKFHIDRTKLIFDWIKSITLGIHNIQYISASDYGIDNNIIKARNNREKDSINKLKIIINDIDNINKFVKWFYEDHKAYASGTDRKESNISADTKLSY